MILYQITDGSASTDEPGWLRRLRGDVDFIQIRERDLCGRELARLVRRAMAAVRGPKILVNDRADVAIACGAAGVHLRAGGAAPSAFRALGAGIVTISCHNAEEISHSAGADYALVSPVFPPLSKPDKRTPLGVEGLRLLMKDSPVPVIALGGITEANAELCVNAGAAGVAGIAISGYAIINM